jgi:hypothetical protein
MRFDMLKKGSLQNNNVEILAGGVSTGVVACVSYNRLETMNQLSESLSEAYTCTNCLFFALSRLERLVLMSMDSGSLFLLLLCHGETISWRWRVVDASP